MQDRFKFRAYCKFYNGEYGLVYFDIKKGLEEVLGDDFVKTEIISIDQCIGAKDSKGTLIYENDIAKVWHINKYVVCSATFSDFTFDYRFEDIFGAAYPMDNDCTVIGDNHQHAFLLLEEEK